MIINLFRSVLASLSFFYKNNLKLVKKKDKIILKNIQSRLNKLSKKNQSLKKVIRILKTRKCKKLSIILNS